MLPGDLDSIFSPPNTPAGTPQDEFYIGSVGDVDNSHLSLYQFHADFATPPNSFVLGSPNTILQTVPTYNGSCSGSYGGACVPSLGGAGMDSLGDRLMYRFAYWNEPLLGQHWYVNGDVESSGGQMGVRWYEFRAPPIPGIGTLTSTTLTTFQAGTFAPDATYRWMGSLAQDKAGDILLGYSQSSATTHPAIYIAGRINNDPVGLNNLESEVLVVQGNGSQPDTNNGWGAYSAMRLDPVDNCTFWYTTEYYMVTQSFDWSTQIASAKFASCNSTRATTTTTITDVEPPSPSGYGTQVTFTAQVTSPTGGSPTGAVTIQDITSGPPVTICTGTLQPNSKPSKRLPQGNGSTATCMTSNPLSVGTHSIQATYTGDANYQASTSAPPISYTVTQATTTTTQLASSLNPSEVNQPVTFTATVTALDQLPTGNVTFSSNGNPIPECPNPVPVMQVGNSSVATCTTLSLPPGADTILASFNDPQGVYSPSSATLAETIQDFSLLSISPGTVTVVQGFNNINEPFFAQAINLAVQPLFGYGGTVTLSCSVNPTLAGGTCLVNSPTSGSLVGGNLNTTLTISAGSSTPIGSYTVTVTAQDSSGLMHFATLVLIVINNATQITMPPGGANRTPVSFNGPTGTSVGNFSCPLVSGTGITGSEDLSKIGGVCTFSPGSVTLPGSVIVTISGCTVARLRTRTTIFAAFWLGMPAIVLLGSARNKRLSRKRMLQLVAMLLLILALLMGVGCGGGYGQLTPTGFYSVLVQGTSADGTVYSAVVPVKVVPLSK